MFFSARAILRYAGLMKFTGAEKFVAEYAKDKMTDFHQLAADIVGVPRKQAKDINLGLFYGMGKNKLAEQLGLEYEDAQELFAEYHAKVPFVQELATFAMNKASKKGVIRTLLGRKCRFNMWEPKDFGIHTPETFENASAKYGSNNIKRAFTYKALNRLIQGSAADQTKQAIVSCSHLGYTPLLQIHDELCFNLQDKSQIEKIKTVMEGCMKLKVPSVVDVAVGDDFGMAT